MIKHWIRQECYTLVFSLLCISFLIFIILNNIEGQKHYIALLVIKIFLGFCILTLIIANILLFFFRKKKYYLLKELESCMWYDAKKTIPEFDSRLVLWLEIGEEKEFIYWGISKEVLLLMFKSYVYKWCYYEDWKMVQEIN
jgi:hypothetical protein